jgi:DNA-binding response OmpR family regulator
MVDILIVEDNREIADLLRDFLQAENYTVSIAGDGERAIALFEKYGARLVVLDVMLPGTDGFSVCRRIREANNTPILIVSARTSRGDKLNGLLLGADDYIEKPLDVDLLIAKINGIFRRRYSTDLISCGDLTIDKIERTVTRRGQLLQMTAKEFDLLLFLIENRGTPLSKELLFRTVWGFDSFSETQTLTVHIKWLREKIEDDPSAPKHIRTVWGVGYRFDEA